MYLKVTTDAPLFSELFNIFNDELERQNQFRKWQVENLPEFNGNVLTQRSPWYMYSNVVAWKFLGEVDMKTWQNVRGFEGYYEPNRRTKAGKEMAKRINLAIGHRFNRFGFFDIFKTSIPCYGREFTLPTGFVFDDVVYMCFDDGNYNDIKNNLEGHFSEITRSEWEAAAKAYNDAQTEEIMES